MGKILGLEARGYSLTGDLGTCMHIPWGGKLAAKYLHVVFLEAYCFGRRAETGCLLLRTHTTLV